MLEAATTAISDAGLSVAMSTASSRSRLHEQRGARRQPRDRGPAARDDGAHGRREPDCIAATRRARRHRRHRAQRPRGRRLERLLGVPASEGYRGRGAVSMAAPLPTSPRLLPPYGARSAAQFYAWIATRYQKLFGILPTDTGSVAVAFRKHAQRNAKALMRDTPLTMDDYLESRGSANRSGCSTAASRPTARPRWS